MAEFPVMSEADYEQQVIDRTRFARECSGLTQAAVAKALGVPADRYRKWESQSPMPNRYIPRFAIVVRAERDWVLWGEGQPPKTLAERVA